MDKRVARAQKKQVAANRKVQQALRDRGDDLDRSREVDHVALFSDLKTATDAAGELAKAGFTVDDPQDATGTIVLEFHSQDAVAGSGPDRFTRTILRIIYPHGGAYDGWGCNIVPRGPSAGGAGSDVASVAPRKWDIYTLKHKDGRPYFVGRTSRPMEMRISEHERSHRMESAEKPAPYGVGLPRQAQPDDAVTGFDQFWELIARADTPPDLHRALASMSDAELLAFEHYHDLAFHGSCNWGLWAAPYMMFYGCSDDAFDYFRAYLISLGRDAFEAALANPDVLADLEIEAEQQVWEDWMSPTMVVIRERTGRPSFAGPLDPKFWFPRSPTGQEWADQDLPVALPRLAAKYGSPPT